MTVNIDVDRSQIQRRTRDGQIFDVVDYPFRVTKRQARRIVRVGITGVWHDPAEAMGSRNLSQDELIEAARAWLSSRIEKGECNPISGSEADVSIDLPSNVMDYWAEHREIPSWI